MPKKPVNKISIFVWHLTPFLKFYFDHGKLLAPSKLFKMLQQLFMAANIHNNHYNLRWFKKIREDQEHYRRLKNIQEN